jgi:hypothetical protein
VLSCLGRTDTPRKRLRLPVPLELFKEEDPASSQRTITENVCSNGARVLARRMSQPNERLMVSFLEDNLRTQRWVSGRPMSDLVSVYSAGSGRQFRFGCSMVTTESDVKRIELESGDAHRAAMSAVLLPEGMKKVSVNGH